LALSNENINVFSSLRLKGIRKVLEYLEYYGELRQLNDKSVKKQNKKGRSVETTRTTIL
jgi:hypothetical protein